MCKDDLRRVWLLAAVASLLAASAALAAPAAPPPLNIPDSALSGPLPPLYAGQMRDRAKYWFDMMLAAKDERDILAAKQGLISDYNANGSASYRYAMAEVVAEQGIVALQKATDLQKQVNIALAIARMPQVSIQPALEAMVVHPNPAVRYLGWAGYRDIRLLVLAQGGEFVKKMFASLDKRLGAEESSLVVGMMFQAMSLPPSDPTLTAESLTAAQKQMLALLQKHWPKRCGQVMAGDVEMASAARRGMSTLRSMADIWAADKPAMTSVMQMVMDMTWSAYKAYDAAVSVPKDAPDAAAHAMVADAMAGLLKDCEDALNAATKQRSRYIESPIADPKVSDKGAAVGTGVLNWLDELTKAFGVKRPEIVPLGATSAPATVPAATTATAPATTTSRPK